MSKRSSLKPFLLFGLILAASSCHREVAEPTVGAYRATLTLPGGEAPFGLEVAREEGKYVLYLVNGTERTRVPDVQVQNQELRAHFQGYENTLEAKLFRDRIEGNVTLIKAGGVLQVIPFKAELGTSYRFYSTASTDNADVAGRWHVKFTDDDGAVSDAVAELSQSHDHVSGTVLTPTGDHRFLEGQVHGDELMLSTFAGGLAYLYKLRVAKGGGLQGDYWQGLKEHVRVQADRDAAAQYTIANTQLQEGAKLAFTFRDSDGKQVSLDDERFRNKVVIVTLGGTWCPNCHDEAEFLEPFYKAHRDEGFEVIGLMLERHPEFEQAAAAVKRFKQDFGIDYTLLIAGVSDKDEATKSLPFLKAVLGYPTALFIDRKGVVRKIHTGFSGPATGEHYEHYKEEFTSFVTALLNERA